MKPLKPVDLFKINPAKTYVLSITEYMSDDPSFFLAKGQEIIEKIKSHFDYKDFLEDTWEDNRDSLREFLKDVASRNGDGDDYYVVVTI